jgi:hypothetical protein
LSYGRGKRRLGSVGPECNPRSKVQRSNTLFNTVQFPAS